MEALINKMSFGQLKTRRFVIYYLLFTVCYILIHYSFVSVVAFFHFLLDHELSTVEQWLNYNGWELILSSKILTCFIFNKILKLNFDNFSFRKDILGSVNFLIDPRIILIAVVLNVFLYVLVYVFGGEVTPLETEYNSSLLLSFFGMALFYLLDFSMLKSLDQCVKIVRPQVVRGLMIFMPMSFYLASQLILPDMSMNQHFLFFNYFMILAIFFNDRNNISNILIYTFSVISLSSLIWGFDLVWEDKFAVFSHVKTVPWLGYFLVWLTTYLYYKRSTR